MTQLSSNDVPSMGRRQFMNLLTFGTATGVALGALYPVATPVAVPNVRRFINCLRPIEGTSLELN